MRRTRRHQQDTRHAVLLAFLDSMAGQRHPQATKHVCRAPREDVTNAPASESRYS
jgi:hypothetical protein